MHSAGHKKLLFPPDTDVYHIGLTVISPSECDVYVQLSPISSVELHLNTRPLAIQSDPDLALVSPGLRPWVLQTLFIGCVQFSGRSRGVSKFPLRRQLYI